MSDLPLRDRLRSSTLFSTLPAGAVDEILHVQGARITLEAGQVLFEAGDAADAIYMVLSGTLKVQLDTERGTVELSQLDPGEVLGELGVLRDRPRNARVVARESCDLLGIRAEPCRALMAAHPAFDEALTRMAAHRLPSMHLRSVDLFKGLDDAGFERLDDAGRWLRLPAGSILFEQGDPADAMYVVVHGSVGVEVATEGGTSRAVQVLGRGASIGEMAMLETRPRTATVRAVRDSELLRIDQRNFDQLARTLPGFGLALARTLAKRLRVTTQRSRSQRSQRAIALVPSGPEGLPEGLGEILCDAMRALGLRVAWITVDSVEEVLGDGLGEAPSDHPGISKLLDWLHTQEQANDYVVYACGPTLSHWTRRALRQSDRLLIAGHAGASVEPGPVERFAAEDPTVQRLVRALVLLHPEGTTRPTGTSAWLDAREVDTWHHVAMERPDSWARLARLLTRRGIAVACSGGGTRGFAHIGSLKAMADFSIPVDLIGGTSMGSIIAAQFAMGMSPEEMVATNFDAFTGAAVITDFTVPVVSLMKAASTVRMLKDLFGDLQAEDLWIPYFAVSVNLSRAEQMIHRRGPLWLWTRASSAVPGIAPPVAHNGELLVDGGLLNNLPVGIAEELGGGHVVALDASSGGALQTKGDPGPSISGWVQLYRNLHPGWKGRRFPNIVQILTRASTFGNAQTSHRARTRADLYLCPPTGHIDVLDWSAVDEVMQIGHRYTTEVLEQWIPAGGQLLARGAGEDMED